MYYNNHDVRIVEMPVPELADDELLVKVKSSGICGSDVMEWYRIKTAPRVLGHEIAGDIAKVGKQVKKYQVGDRVFVSHHVPCNSCVFCEQGKHTLCDTLHSTNFDPGGFAEYIRVPSINVDRGVFVLPDGMSYDDGVFIEPLACVVRGARIAGLHAGQIVVVIGSGIAGLLQVKLACAQGAKQVIAVDINQYRLAKAQQMGADVGIDATEDVPKKIKKITKGRMADLVIIATGAPSAHKQGLRCVGRGGTILFFAPTAPGVEIPFPLFDLWNKGVTMVSTYAGSPDDIDEAITLLQTKKVRVADMVSHSLPLSEAAQGFKLVAEADKSLKVVLHP